MAYADMRLAATPRYAADAALCYSARYAAIMRACCAALRRQLYAEALPNIRFYAYATLY